MAEAQQNSLLINISAPSGGGKTTVCQQVLASRPNVSRAITCTTRAPRAGEREGVDYYFLDNATFRKREAAGDFLEHATVFGHYYGTLKSEVLGKLRQGKDVLLAIDVQGAASIRAAAQKDPELRRALVTVFITPPSLSILEQRLKNRGLDAPAVIEERLRKARGEIAQAAHYDYLLISTTIPEDLRRLLAIIEVEKMRVSRMGLPEV